jgi:hypothetical protein
MDFQCCSRQSVTSHTSAPETLNRRPHSEYKATAATRQVRRAHFLCQAGWPRRWRPPRAQCLILQQPDHMGRGCVQAQSTKVKAEPLPAPDDAASPYPYREPQVCPSMIVGLFPVHLNSALDPLYVPCRPHLHDFALNHSATDLMLMPIVRTWGASSVQLSIVPRCRAHIPTATSTRSSAAAEGRGCTRPSWSGGSWPSLYQRRVFAHASLPL